MNVIVAKSFILLYLCLVFPLCVLTVDKIFIAYNKFTFSGLKGLYESPCPVMGEYTGFIPNKMQLCAKLSSDETFPEIMYYTVSDCRALEEIYEGK